MKVRGYIKPESSFLTLQDWEWVVNLFLDYQNLGYNTRGGKLPLELNKLVDRFFGYLLQVDSNRYELLTKKNVLDFIEDFVNHRFWSLEEELKRYFPNTSNLKISFFYSRGDIEPYILLDQNLTKQLYGGSWNPKRLMHYTTNEGVEAIKKSIGSGRPFDISCFTVSKSRFFDTSSSRVITLLGNVKAGFRSDVKSLVIDSGNRAVNLYRLEYPGKDLNNICYNLDDCDDEIRTSLWNEYIATPIKIISIE